MPGTPGRQDPEADDLCATSAWKECEYQELFPDTQIPKRGGGGLKRDVDYFDTLSHGFYKAVGVTGSLTGTPADIAIIDDPVKDKIEAYSDTYRQRVWDWYTDVLSTRLHNGSKQLRIMT